MSEPVKPVRRRLLRALLGTGIAGLSGAGAAALLRNELLNPCLADLPPPLATHPILKTAWAGIDPAAVWDVHAHMAGNGDSGSGISLSPRMLSPQHPLDYLQRLAYLNAGCASDAPGSTDNSYVARLNNLMDGLPAGAKLMLFAFDRTYDLYGNSRPGLTAFHVPDAYARTVAAAQPQRFEWVCSVHPYRRDAIEALEAATRGGARAVKWLPPAQGIDPAHPACDAFYDALVRLDLPLICHGGSEKAVRGAGQDALGNPLLLRRPLDKGVRVVIAHCASEGEAADLDRPGQPEVPAFQLFARLMDENATRNTLYGDISALSLRNRHPAIVRTVLQRQDWHGRLLYGSDYPLPGVIPLIAPTQLARAGLLPAEAAAPLQSIRAHNPLLFHFALMRHLVSDGVHLPSGVFMTRAFFERNAA